MNYKYKSKYFKSSVDLYDSFESSGVEICFSSWQFTVFSLDCKVVIYCWFIPFPCSKAHFPFVYSLTFLSLRGFLILILSFLLSELLDQSDFIFFKAVGRLPIPIYFKCDIINLVTSTTFDVRIEIRRYLRKNMERLGLLLSGRVLPVWKAQI